MNKSQALEIFKENSIYFVTSEEVSCGWKDEEIVKEVLRAGVKVIQLRDKKSSRQQLLDKAHQLRKITRDYDALLFINDDVPLALEVEADGVHLGQEDMPISEARKISQENHRDLILGLSTHHLDEILAVENSQIKPDYINIGPIFPTQTKENSYPAIVDPSTKNYHELKKLIAATSLPFTVMGGIKGEHLDDLFQLGVRRFAMISEITLQKSPYEHVKELLRKIEQIKVHFKVESIKC